MGCAHPQPCPEHGRRRDEQVRRNTIDRRRGSAASRGYGHRWQRYRTWYLNELHRLDVPRAGLCGSRLPGAPETQDSVCARQGLTTLGRVVDHIIPVSSADDPSFYAPEAHQLLCDPCHNAKRGRESKGPERVVVCGPPGSGKSTWVRQRALPGDLVWDLDAIASTMAYKGEPIPRDQKGRLPWPVMKATLAMRDALVAWLETAQLFRAAVYLIITDPYEAERVAQRLGATLHQCVV